MHHGTNDLRSEESAENFLLAVILVDVGVLQNPCIMNCFPKFFKNDIQKTFEVNYVRCCCWYFDQVGFFITKPQRFFIASVFNKILSLIAYPVQYPVNTQ